MALPNESVGLTVFQASVGVFHSFSVITVLILHVLFSFFSLFFVYQFLASFPSRCKMLMQKINESLNKPFLICLWFCSFVCTFIYPNPPPMKAQTHLLLASISPFTNVIFSLNKSLLFSFFVDSSCFPLLLLLHSVSERPGFNLEDQLQG